MVQSAVSSPVVEDLDRLFRGFADPTRVRILNTLVAGELCVCDIMTILDSPQSTASRHLAYLLKVGLVEVDREWKFAHYRLAAPANSIHTNLLNCVRTCFLGIESLDTERAHAVRRVRERETNPCE